MNQGKIFRCQISFSFSYFSESYLEDYNDAQKFGSQAERLDFYFNMKSGAESGWDYSTKWFMGPNGEPSSQLTDINARRVVPVELNSYLCRNARVMAHFHEVLGNADRQGMYEGYRRDLEEAVDALLWNDELGAWFDYDLDHGKQRLQFYPSNVGPLWADCYRQTRNGEKVKAAVKYLKSSGAMEYPGGVPTSMEPSGQQWDFR